MTMMDWFKSMNLVHLWLVSKDTLGLSSVEFSTQYSYNQNGTFNVFAKGHYIGKEKTQRKMGHWKMTMVTLPQFMGVRAIVMHLSTPCGLRG